MFKCEFCDKEFKTKNALTGHLGQKHKEELLDRPVRIVSRSNDHELDISVRELQKAKSKHSGVCDVCGKKETANTRPDTKTTPNSLCIDHDHNTKKFRGFLCVQCNRNFGWYDKYTEEIQNHANFNNRRLLE